MKVVAERKRVDRLVAARAAAPRPRAAGRVVRVPAAREARAARGRVPVRGPAHARDRWPRPPSSRRSCAARRLGDSAKELVDGHALARPGDALAARRARSPPTTAPSTSRSAATSTTSRAHASTSAAARTSSARCSSRPRVGNVVASRAPVRYRARRPDRRGRRRRRGLDRDLRLDAAPSRDPRRPCAREARPRVPAPRRDRGADARAARGRRGGPRRLPGARKRRALHERRSSFDFGCRWTLRDFALTWIPVAGSGLLAHVRRRLCCSGAR